MIDLISKEKLVNGRKEYRCSCCGATIPKGLVHWYFKYHTDNGSFHVNRFHVECAAAVGTYCMDNDVGCWRSEDVSSHIRKYMKENKIKFDDNLSDYEVFERWSDYRRIKNTVPAIKIL